jgi:hypothetical protein
MVTATVAVARSPRAQYVVRMTPRAPSAHTHKQLSRRTIAGKRQVFCVGAGRILRRDRAKANGAEYLPYSASGPVFCVRVGDRALQGRRPTANDSDLPNLLRDHKATRSTDAHVVAHTLCTCVYYVYWRIRTCASACACV